MTEGKFKNLIVRYDRLYNPKFLKVETFLKIVEEARKEFPSIKDLREIRQYIIDFFVSEAEENGELMPFTLSHFLCIIDKEIEMREKWFGHDD
jgi:hypothetical protein